MTNTVLQPYRHRVPPPSYMAGWSLQEFVNIEQRIAGSAATALWPYAMQDGEDGVVNQQYGFLDIRRYGNISQGSDITVPLQRALAAVVGSLVKRIYIPGGSYVVGQTFALTSAHAGVSIVSDGAGACTITRGFNGPLLTLTNCIGFGLRDIGFDGAYGTHTGKGITLSGTCNYPRIQDCDFVGFSDAHIDFGSNAGYNAKLIANHHFTGSGQGDFLTYAVSANDTTATPRTFTACDSNGYHAMPGALDAQFANCFQTRIETSIDTAEFTCAGGVWADQTNFLVGTPITLRGVNMFMSGIRFANAVVLASGSSGSLAGSGPSGVPLGQLALTDNSGGTWSVLYREATEFYHYVGRSTLTATLTGEIRQTSVQRYGDTDETYTVDSTKTSLFWNLAALTAPRTLTLSTTNAREGCEVHVSRPAAGASALTLGGTGKTLAAGGWAHLIYDGTTWLLKDIGTGL